jgi:hypothetical protein
MIRRSILLFVLLGVLRAQTHDTTSPTLTALNASPNHRRCHHRAGYSHAHLECHGFPFRRRLHQRFGEPRPGQSDPQRLRERHFEYVGEQHVESGHPAVFSRGDLDATGRTWLTPPAITRSILRQPCLGRASRARSRSSDGDHRTRSKLTLPDLDSDRRSRHARNASENE